MQARRYPEFVAASPRGLVPALVHDGVCVNDSMVCCEYLADVGLASTPAMLPLLPADAASRAKVRAAPTLTLALTLTRRGKGAVSSPLTYPEP